MKKNIYIGITIYTLIGGRWEMEFFFGGGYVFVRKFCRKEYLDIKYAKII